MMLFVADHIVAYLMNMVRLPKIFFRCFSTKCAKPCTTARPSRIRRQRNSSVSVKTPMQRRNGLHGLRIRSRVMACCRSHGYAHPYEAE